MKPLCAVPSPVLRMRLPGELSLDMPNEKSSSGNPVNLSQIARFATLTSILTDGLASS
jgi:hypothetical protein